MKARTGKTLCWFLGIILSISVCVLFFVSCTGKQAEIEMAKAQQSSDNLMTSNSNETSKPHDITVSERVQSWSKEQNDGTLSLLEVKDVSFGIPEGLHVRKVKRLIYRLLLDRRRSESEIRNLCVPMVRKAINSGTSAMLLFFYAPESDGHDIYLFGHAEWAPYGDWTRSSEVRLSDPLHIEQYSEHRFIFSLY